MSQLPEPLALNGYLLGVAAKVLGISERTLGRRIERGEIKTIPGPRCSLVPPDELHRIIEQGGLRRGWGGPRRREGAPP